MLGISSTQNELVRALGWTLIHSIWQAAIAAVLLGMALAAARRSGALARYLLSCAALASVMLACVITLFMLQRSNAVTPAPFPSTVIAAAGANAARSSSQVAHATSRPWDEPLLPWIVLAWTAGVMAMAVYHLGGWLLIRRLPSSGSPIEDSAIRIAFDELLERMQISRAVALAQSALIEVPTLVGWLSPIVLLPVSALSGLSIPQIRGLLAHELAHVRRHDYLVNIVQVICETLLFYHPAVWWISRRIRTERENCCDDLAMAYCDRVDYAQALASAEKLRATHVAAALSARGNGPLLPRIQRILGQPGNRHRTPRSLLWSASVVVVVAVLALMPAVIVPEPVAIADQLPATQPTSRPSGNAELPLEIFTQHIGLYYVSGVERPGTYTFGGQEVSLKHALISAGVEDPTGKQAVLIRRDPLLGTIRRVVNIEDLYNRCVEDNLLKSDDVLMVTQAATVLPPVAEIPPVGEFTIAGDVSRPGTFTIGGSHIGLLQALVMANADPIALSQGTITIARKDAPPDEMVAVIRISELLGGKYGDLTLQPGDRMTVTRTNAPATRE